MVTPKVVYSSLSYARKLQSTELENSFENGQYSPYTKVFVIG